MIFGVGTDIVELSRIQATYDRFGDHFVDRLLMEEEREPFQETRSGEYRSSPAKNRRTRSASSESESPRLQTLKLSPVLSATEIATTRC